MPRRTRDTVIEPGRLGWPQVRRALSGPSSFALTRPAWTAVAASAAVVDDLLSRGQQAYGINTGFGRLAQTAIPPGKLKTLQRNLVLSHAAGTGPALGDDVVRLVMMLKAASLARGHSGVRRVLLEHLLAWIAGDALPVIPAQGSVGASGDLAPLAHLSAALIGTGRVRMAGRELGARAALKRLGLSPLVLAPKEGLALLNGTQVSTALGLAGLVAIERVFAAAMVAGAMAVDAAQGSDVPFDARIQAVRGHTTQSDVAAAYRALMAGSEIRRSHEDCEKVQDPYSLRCQPQVMGACLAQMRFAAETLLTEANAVTDNPLVFTEDGVTLSGGNFHAEPVAMAADNLALAVAEIGALSERRIALLTDASMSGLPAFLAAEPGLNSGFMVPHVTAAALVAENKLLAHPASVDSLPTSANQEDHVSMAAHGARRLLAMAENAAAVVAIELLAAAQGIEFRAPLKTSRQLDKALALIRAEVPRYARDRYFAPDLERVKAMVLNGAFMGFLPGLLPAHG